MVCLPLATRQGSPIDNFHNSDSVIYGEELEAKSLKERFPAALHRPTQVCYTYNCHGLTFAARRTAIVSTSELKKILVEDSYERLANAREALPGDIALYIGSSGDIEHSGVVVEAPQGMLAANPKVLSKWGNAHEVIHFANYSPYSGAIEFYRIVR